MNWPAAPWTNTALLTASRKNPASQIKTVRDVLAESGAGQVPELVVFNKADLVDDDTRLILRGLESKAIFVSARTGEGIEELLEIIAERIPSPDVDVHLLVPYDRGDVVSSLHLRGLVLETDYVEEGTRVHARVTPADAAAFAEFAED